MTDNQPTQPVQVKTTPTLTEFRDQRKKKFTLQNIMVGFVFACAFVGALMNSMATIPLTGLALWMELTRDK